jgi:DnaA family protein
VRQLTFELAPPETPAFANFLAGSNGEAIDALRRLAQGTLNETSLVVWGAAGAGKSHLLQATVGEAASASRFARYYGSAEHAPAEPPELGAVLAVDRIDEAASEAQSNLFRLYNALAGTGGQLVVAARAVPAAWPLRPDLRTRLAQGLTYEVHPLADEAKADALRQFAAGRGFALPGDVAAYLLTHCARDMRSLVQAVAALDRMSLASKRPVTLALARECLERAGLSSGSDAAAGS